MIMTHLLEHGSLSIGRLWGLVNPAFAVTSELHAELKLMEMMGLVSVNDETITALHEQVDE